MAQQLPPGAEKEQAVSWLSDISPKDVAAGGDRFNKWLLKISGNHISFEDLKTVASAVPIIGNLMAFYDAVCDIVTIVEKRHADLLDYLGLAINLIGVIPVPPPLASFRLSARPLLALVRNQLLVSRGNLGAAIIGVLVAHVNAAAATEIENFLKTLQEVLVDLLNDCAAKAQELMVGIASGLELALKGQIFDSSANVRRTQQIARKMGERSWYNPKLLVDAFEYGYEGSIALGKEAGNATVGTAAKLAPDSWLQPFRDIVAFLKTEAPKVAKAIRDLNGSEEGKMLWLIAQVIEAVARVRAGGKLREKTADVPTGGKGRAHHDRPQEPVGAVEQHAHPEGPGQSPCKGCGVGASTGSIDFAFGDETFTHTDFELPGALPLVWARTYRSRLSAYDTGELGARWITPYTTRIDIEGDTWFYRDASGRSIEYRALAAGSVHDDLSENLTLSRLDDTWVTIAYGHDELHVYERRGNAFRLAMQKDRAGNTITLDYDARDHVARLIDANGNVLSFEHDKHGRIVLIEQVLEDGKRRTLASYAYDEAADLIRATDRHGNAWNYQYDRHLVTRYTDRTGRGMSLEWDGADADDNANAKCVREYADDGSLDIRLAWHPNIRLTYVTDALGQTTRYYFNIKGYVYRIAYPDGSEEWFRRDEHNNLTLHILPDGSVEQMRYDARGNRTWHERADGSIVEMAYDDKDQMIRLVDPNGHVWQRKYDDAGNLVEEIDPLEHSTKYSYNDKGLPTQITDAKGGSKALEYNAAGQLTGYTDCSGKKTAWRYDDIGRAIETKDASGGVVAYAYGPNGQLTEIRSPAGVEHVQHDAEGRLLGHTDQLNRSTRYGYDAVGRIASRSDALGQTIAYRYDRLGRLTALTDANFATYQFRYDPAGRLIEEIAFDGKSTRYQYDPDSGSLVSIDEAGCVTSVDVDVSGRLLKRVAGESEERFAYDPSGRLIDAVNRYSRVQFFFDPVGNLVREHHAYDLFGDRRSYVWHHEYDELGNRRRTVRPDGHAVDWLMYGSGHVHGMLLDGEERVQFERDDLHRETVRVLSSKVGQRTHYDPAGRVLQQTIQRSTSPAPLAERRYRYDAVGQLSRIEDSRKGGTDYRYDPVGRLIEAISPVAKERFAFDPASNIIDPVRTAETPASRPSPVRPESTLPVEVPKVLGNLLKAYAGMHFEYDARGNLVRKRTPAGEQEYEWDEFNRLLSARVAETSRQSQARYFYDAFGRRIAKEVNGARTVFGWDGDTLAYESDGERGTHYLYEPGTFVPLAQYVAEPVEGIETPVWTSTDRYVPEEDPLQKVPERRGDAAVFYYHCDQIGTPQLLTDDDGDVVWEASYKAWGEAREVIARASKAAGIVAKNPLRFQGQQGDDETGLHYNRHRYYDPSSGRFISKDPISLAGGINVYQYAPSPIEWIDPLGLSRFKKGTWGPCKKGTGLAYTVFRQDIDWDMEHRGKTNLQRAMEGGAPFMMKDGVPQQIQLHHSRQQSMGPLFEVTTSTHRAARGAGREALHPYGNQKNPDFPVDRDAFDIDRKQYWQDRAAEANASKNGGCDL
ncbi:RHS repeat-associated core domain-containing protein [Burkholderia cenocepacia]|uniref:RHS repeat-associated core domain-containing protein n=1 Tax=Burkholderia cenocepacia TaxID=95486 RepID=UPI000F58FED0|nr:RHS repeat-associated core domain-containing protein [Burkholderia cenocepacia]MBR8512127.1 RHS domain-containing protein [Burkholderia cenocepacia]RQV51828.1 sugar-binding protein [Burkholderia cenocepacia]